MRLSTTAESPSVSQGMPLIMIKAQMESRHHSVNWTALFEVCVARFCLPNSAWAEGDSAVALSLIFKLRLTFCQVSISK